MSLIEMVTSNGLDLVSTVLCSNVVVWRHLRLFQQPFVIQQHSAESSSKLQV
jgi:hypothetical protein